MRTATDHTNKKNLESDLTYEYNKTVWEKSVYESLTLHAHISKIHIKFIRSTSMLKSTKTI